MPYSLPDATLGFVAARRMLEAAAIILSERELDGNSSLGTGPALQLVCRVIGALDDLDGCITAASGNADGAVKRLPAA